MPISNRFCLPYISPGVSFVCLDKKHLERLSKHLDLLGPLIARSQPLGYEHWRIFVQHHNDDIPATFTLGQSPQKNNKPALWPWPRKHNHKKGGLSLTLPVFPLADFDKFEHFDIICCSDKLAPLRLRQASAANKALFFLADTTRIMRGFDSIEQKYRQHEEKIRQTAQLLQSPADARLLLNALFPLQTRSFTHTSLSDYPEYFHPAAAPRPGDLVISGGVSASAASELEICRAVGSSGKIYAFEPDPDGVRGAKEFFSQHPDVQNMEIVPLGLWRKKETVTFVSGLGHSSYVKESAEHCRSAEKHQIKSGAAKDAASQTQAEITLPMTSIDEFVKDRGLNRLDFIKLDIEGSELAALEGARQSFLTFAPRFAICIYHKPEDIWTIPQFIKDLEKDGLRYELYFGLHSQSPFSEMILYGRPNAQQARTK
jgi:FkbM family methyltransferase